MKSNVHSVANSFVDIIAKNAGTQYDEFAPELNEEIIALNLQFAEKVFPQNGLMVCPVSHTKTKYFSSNCEYILGYSQRTLLQWSLADFFGLVHPEDLPLVHQCLGFIKSLTPFDPELYRFDMRYRFRNSRGEYLHVKAEKIAIKTQTNSYLYLILLSDVSTQEKFYHVKLTTYRKIKNNYLKEYTYNPQQSEKEITPRQNDIAKLIMKGFTNQEIADHLRVSVYTVKNHKQMLFKKINVKSSLELANYVREISV